MAALPGDSAIVYDDQRHASSHKSLFLTVLHKSLFLTVLHKSLFPTVLHPFCFQEPVPHGITHPPTHTRMTPGVAHHTHTHLHTHRYTHIHTHTHTHTHTQITPGMAHLSDTPFADAMPEGWYWSGKPWRHRREFVGRLSYGMPNRMCIFTTETNASSWAASPTVCLCSCVFTGLFCASAGLFCHIIGLF